MTIDSTGPYPVVRSFGPGPTWTADLVRVLGGTGGPNEFGSVRSVLLAGDGSLYVVDPSYHEVSLFDSAGRFVRRLGREGAGPGEYRDPYSVAWLGENLALLDPGNSRIGLFSPSGEWVTSWIVQPITGGQGVRLYRTPPTFWSLGFRPKGARPEQVLVQYTPTGPADTLPLVRPPSGLAPLRRCNRPDKAITFFAAPFGRAPLAIPTPGGRRAAALNTDYRVAFIRPPGDTVSAIERRVQPAPISDADWAQATAEWVVFRADWPTATCDRGDFERPQFRPPLVSLFYDDVGRLWVELMTQSGPRYDVFDRAGRLLATVDGLPSTGGIDPSIAGERIAVAGHDTADAPVVRIFRIAR